MERVRSQSKLAMFFKALLGNESQDFEDLNAEQQKELEAIRKLNPTESDTKSFPERVKLITKKHKTKEKDIEKISEEKTIE